jgi:serine/threonine protein kinase
MGYGKVMATSRNEPQHPGIGPERWRQIKGILSGALETDPSRQATFLDQACADDPLLRAEIETLLSFSNDVNDNRLNSTGSRLMVIEAVADTQSSDTRIGRRFGPYQIIEEIGVGGMGEVYRAFRADDEYQKEVAIKVVQAGQNSKFVIARFKNERQVLASLDHPNIARLLDGGTSEEGVPYLVMELIEGLPINEYCDEQKLSVHDRLELFLQLCSAVQFAHQRLIVHRDLKPSNILVTSDGTPKLLDFGIAKIIGPSASEVCEFTLSIFQPLTPAYASPEQIKGETITTVSDVYSLGVLLYELLTGHAPYRTSSQAAHEIANAVCEQQPGRPSLAIWRTERHEKHGRILETTPASVSGARGTTPEKLNRLLRGDLDNVILTGLRKEPQQRYSSVEQFAGDIRRHLDRLPVAASSGTLFYRMSKFVRRHQAGVLTALIILLIAITGLVAILYEADKARQNQLRAERRFNDVRVLANSLVFEVHDAIKDLAGATPARRLLVEKALQYLQSLSQDAGGDSSLQNEVATAYEKVGDVQGNPDFPNLGDTVGALASYRHALALRQSLAGAVADQEMQANLAGDYGRIGMMLELQGDNNSALGYYRQEFAIAENLAITSPGLKSDQRLASVYFLMGRCYSALRDHKNALEHYQKSAALRETLATASPMAKTRLAGTYAYMVPIVWSMGDRNRAIFLQRRALEIMRELSNSDPSNAFYREYLDEAYYGVGFYLQKEGNLSQALVNYRRALSDFERLASADPQEVHTRRNLALCNESIGTTLVAQGDTAHGLQSIRSALTMAEKLPRPQNSDLVADAYYSLGIALSRLAATHNSSAVVTNDLTQACSAFQKSLDSWSELPSANQLGLFNDGNPGPAQGELTKCEARLAKLKKR